MGYILLRCREGPNETIWRLAHNLWLHDPSLWPQLNIGTLLGCGTIHLLVELASLSTEKITPLDVTIRTPKGPYFYFLSRPLSFSHPLPHLLPFLTTSHALLTICSTFPALVRDLPFLVARIPGLYLVRSPALVIVA